MGAKFKFQKEVTPIACILVRLFGQEKKERVLSMCVAHLVKVKGLACLQPNVDLEKYSLVMLDPNMGLCSCIKTYITWGYF